jgi:exoribonuclease-2
VGEYFDALVSGLNDSGVWVRVIAPPVEGKLVGRVPELAMGSRLRVRLTATNVDRGFIDFSLAP